MSQLNQGEIFALTADEENTLVCHMKASRDFDMNEVTKLFAGPKVSVFAVGQARPRITSFIAWLIAQEYAQPLDEFPVFWLGTCDVLHN